MSYNKGLNIIIDTPRRTVYANGLFEDIPGKHARFQGGMYETEDPDEIKLLMSHRLFNARPGVPGAFWEYVPPRNIEAELEQAKKELEEARAAKAEAEAALAKTVKEQKKPQSSPSVLKPIPGLKTKEEIESDKQVGEVASENK